MSKHTTGRKVADTHTSATDTAKKIVRAAETLPEVRKIALGPIVWGLPSGQPRLKFTAINGGWRIDVRGPTNKQLLYVYTSAPRRTEEILSSALG